MSFFWTSVVRLKLILNNVKPNGCVATGPVHLSIGKGGRVELGRGVFFRPHVELKIRDNGLIILGAAVRLDFGVRITVAQNFSVTLADHTEIGHSTLLNGGHDITIGKGVAVGPHCVLQSSEHVVKPDSNNAVVAGGYIRGPISIGANTWLASFVIIRPETKIGEHCVVGAFSLVKGEIKDGLKVAGIPASTIKS